MSDPEVSLAPQEDLGFRPVLEFNLEATLSRKLDGLFKISWTVWLVGEGDCGPLEQLDGECDAVNRRMLDELYMLSHVDKTTVRTEYHGDPLLGYYFAARTTYRSPHGFYFEEVASRSGDSYSFMVRGCDDVVGKPPTTGSTEVMLDA
jgi:hypothetical protein